MGISFMNKFDVVRFISSEPAAMIELTEEQHAALVDYWAARTPDDEKAAYARMMALGMPDSYALRESRA